MTVLYKLAKEQLSKQYHYDFGLRALKSVLVMAGGLKRGSPEFDECTILMRALRDMNMPKFVFADVPLFRGLIGDLFPGLDCPRVRYPRSTTRSSRPSTDDGLPDARDAGRQGRPAVRDADDAPHHDDRRPDRRRQDRRARHALPGADHAAGCPPSMFVINPKAIPSRSSTASWTPRPATGPTGCSPTSSAT